MSASMLYHVTGTLFIEYGLFSLADRDDPHSPLYQIGAGSPLRGGTGLLAAIPGQAEIICGVHTGEITVTVETWDTAPEPDLGAWEDVVEVSVTWPTGQAAVCGSDTSVITDIPLHLPPAPGHSFRVRDSVRHRDTGEDRGPHDPAEHHLIQIWPAPPHPDHLLKTTDNTGTHWRQNP